MVIHSGSLCQHVPNGCDHHHDVWGQSLSKGAKKVTQRHDDLLPQPMISVARQCATQYLHKSCYVMAEGRKEHNLSSILGEGCGITQEGCGL